MLDQFRAHGLASRVQPFVSTQSSTTEWSSRGRMRVLIADDHRLIIEGVKTKLEELDNDVEFVEAMTVAELHAQLDSTPLPDVAVIDLSMPGALGPDHIAAVLRRYPDMPVVVLSGAEDAAQMKMLLDLGVRGYIPKAYSPEIMLSAVRLVMSGGVYVPPMLLAAAPGAVANNGHRNLDSLDALRSEEHTSELQSLMRNSYAVFCLKKK